MDLEANKLQYFQKYYYMLKLLSYVVIVFVWKANRGPNNCVERSLCLIAERL